MGDRGIQAYGLRPALVHVYGVEHAHTLAIAFHHLGPFMSSPMHSQFELTHPGFYKIPTEPIFTKLSKVGNSTHHESKYLLRPTPQFFLRECAQEIGDRLNDLAVKSKILSNQGMKVRLPRGRLAEIVGEAAHLEVDWSKFASTHPTINYELPN